MADTKEAMVCPNCKTNQSTFEVSIQHGNAKPYYDHTMCCLCKQIIHQGDRKEIETPQEQKQLPVNLPQLDNPFANALKRRDDIK